MTQQEHQAFKKMIKIISDAWEMVKENLKGSWTDEMEKEHDLFNRAKEAFNNQDQQEIEDIINEIAKLDK